MGGHPEILLLAFADADVDASFEDDLHDAIAALAAEPRDWVLGAPALVDETDSETGVRTIGAVLRLHAARAATGRLLDATLDRRELDDARAFVAALQPVSAARRPHRLRARRRQRRLDRGRRGRRRAARRAARLVGPAVHAVTGGDERFEVVPRLPVEIAPPSPHGALEPALSGEDLVIEGDLDGLAPFGANVASLLILDLDDDRVVSAVEVLVPRSQWQRAPAPLRPSGRLPRGSLRIVSSRVEVQLEDVEPRFLLDPAGELAIVLEAPRPDSRWVALSDACRAWTNDGFLGGFAVAL